MEKEKTVGKIECWPIEKLKARRIETRADLSMICPAKTGEGDYIRTSTRHEKGESRIGRTALATFIDSVGRSRVVPGLASPTNAMQEESWGEARVSLGAVRAR